MPFELCVPQRELDDLRGRLARTRWLDEFPGSGWRYGTSRSYLEELCRYWREDFDWRACEGRLNSFGQVAIDVDGQRIHAVLTMPAGEPLSADDPEAGLSEGERQGLRDWAAHQAGGTVIHLPLNTTRPHTLAFAVNDSPAGLAAWLVEMSGRSATAAATSNAASPRTSCWPT